ncbi:MAG: apolipoprotein N-acyltransferase [Coxiellaceae bacterium]|nr:apolipoprotein N-acyltransferase [Coxiellaceae bacterium]
MIFWISLFSLLDGAFLVSAFAPFNIDYAAFFLLAVLLFVLIRVTPKQALWIGFLFGLGFFGAGISWIYISIHSYGNASVALASLITFLLIAFLALFPATLCYVFRKCFSRFSPALQCLIIFPVLWTGWELIRGSILSGFPWLLIGYTQLKTPLSGLAPIVGVYGLSFITLIISGALVLISEKKSLKIHCLSLGLIVLFFGSGMLFNKHAWTTPVGKPFSVSLIQGNIPQIVKWDPNYALQTINVYKQLTIENIDHQLVIWPEGAMPVYSNDAELFIRKLGELAKAHQSNIIFGIPIQESNHAYNGLLLIGDNNGKYLKKHLVPFGEYTPFKPLIEKVTNYFKIPMSDFDAGPNDQAPLTVDHFRIAPFICYEIIFPLRVWQESINSNVLLSLSDDSWFGKSLAPWQQFQMAEMRSLETGRPQLVATNTGVTAFISPFGRKVAMAPLEKQAVLTQMVQPMEGKTPLMRMVS